MAADSKIEWTDATWNPVTGCSPASQGCRNCYAASVAAGRLRNHPSRAGLTKRMADGRAVFTGELRFNERWLLDPLRWRKPRRIFVGAHTDLFHEGMPPQWIDRVFAVMAIAPWHTFQILTKRPQRMFDYLSGKRPVGDAAICAAINAIPARLGDRRGCLELPLPNVWLGTSAEDQAMADERLPWLLRCPAAVHFLSAEPLLGPIDLDGHIHRLGWVIVGGESGDHARPMHPGWARSLRDQCRAAGVPFFFKQWGEFASVSEVEGPGAHHYFEDGATVRRVGKAAAGATLDHAIIQEFPR